MDFVALHKGFAAFHTEPHQAVTLDLRGEMDGDASEYQTHPSWDGESVSVPTLLEVCGVEVVDRDHVRGSRDSQWDFQRRIHQRLP